MRLDAAARASAAFLDQRALPPSPEGYWVPLQAVFDAPAPAPARLDWIFHIGHCGSTLLSRLMQAWPDVATLREPLPLRAVAEAMDAGAVVPRGLERRLAELWARPLPPSSRTLVKATSSCNVLAAPLLDAMPSARAVLLDMPLRPYLATVLKSQASLADVAAAAPGRARVLAAGDDEVATELAALPVAEQCAMGWLAEQLRFGELASGPVGGRVLRVDFEALLATPRDTLARIAAHLRLDAVHLPAALDSPWWHRYAKAGDHAYGVADRRHDLALADERHGEARDRALAWLDGFLERHPALARRAGIGPG